MPFSISKCYLKKCRIAVIHKTDIFTEVHSVSGITYFIIVSSGRFSAWHECRQALRHSEHHILIKWIEKPSSLMKHKSELTVFIRPHWQCRNQYQIWMKPWDKLNISVQYYLCRKLAGYSSQDVSQTPKELTSIRGPAITFLVTRFLVTVDCRFFVTDHHVLGTHVF